jgi:hypothetical protein
VDASARLLQLELAATPRRGVHLPVRRPRHLTALSCSGSLSDDGSIASGSGGRMAQHKYQVPRHILPLPQRVLLAATDTHEH